MSHDEDSYKSNAAGVDPLEKHVLRVVPNWYAVVLIVMEVMKNVHFLHLVPYLTVVNPDILSRNVETIRVECSHVYYLSSMMMMVTIETINNTIYFDDGGGNYDHDEIVTIMMTMAIIIITITIITISPHDDLHQSAELTPHSFWSLTCQPGIDYKTNLPG